MITELYTLTEVFRTNPRSLLSCRDVLILSTYRKQDQYINELDELTIL